MQQGAPPQGSAARCATGIAALDHLLDGGFPRGRLSEVAGPEGGGRTSLLLAWLARLTATGAWAGWVDVGDTFDPPSAQAAGVDLERVLWIRPPDPVAALRAAAHVLEAGGFAGLVLDLAPGAATPPLRLPAAAWPRLRRSAAASDTALVVLARTRLAGACADLVLETGPGRARFARSPDWLEGLEAPVQLVRRRGGAPGRAAPLCWKPAA